MCKFQPKLFRNTKFFTVPGYYEFDKNNFTKIDLDILTYFTEINIRQKFDHKLSIGDGNIQNNTIIIDVKVVINKGAKIYIICDFDNAIQ